MISKRFVLMFYILVSFLCFSNCNIHRAILGNPGYQIPLKIRNTDIINNDDDDDNDDYDDKRLGYFDQIYQKANLAWLYAIPAAILVGSTGIFPLLIFKVEEGHELKEAISPSSLKLLLSFAVGGLLGDVFLHLLPESWMYINKNAHDNVSGLKIGLWVLAGFLCFLILEKIFFEEEKIKEQMEKQHNAGEKMLHKLSAKLIDEKLLDHDDPKKNDAKTKLLSANAKTNGDIGQKVNIKKEKEPNPKPTEGQKSIVEPGDKDDVIELTEEHVKVIGYLNLLANCIDNFTHGLAVGGSFIVSIPVGVCTTLAILLHEIPHEIGDFAILLKAGFKRWEAAKGQMLTASGALFGCLFGLLAEGAGDSSAWVLPFTSGGFLYIALVTVVPDLLKEDNLKESLKQIASLFLGIGTMAVVSFLH